MNLVNFSAAGATVYLDRRELLMVMALVQEGRDSFECESETGRALDQLFSTAVVKVEDAYRRELKRRGLLPMVGPVMMPEDAVSLQRDGSLG